MTTLTSCRKGAKKTLAAQPALGTLYIMHAAGHVDRRGTDRGFTILAQREIASYPEWTLTEEIKADAKPSA